LDTNKITDGKLPLYYHEKVSEKLVKTFLKEFESDHQYKHLEDTFISKCGIQCKIIFKCTRINQLHYEEALEKKIYKESF